jgi:hypothetical protein
MCGSWFSVISLVPKFQQWLECTHRSMQAEGSSSLFFFLKKNRWNWIFKDLRWASVNQINMRKPFSHRMSFLYLMSANDSEELCNVLWLAGFVHLLTDHIGSISLFPEFQSNYEASLFLFLNRLYIWVTQLLYFVSKCSITLLCTSLLLWNVRLFFNCSIKLICFKLALNWI